MKTMTLKRVSVAAAIALFASAAQAEVFDAAIAEDTLRVSVGGPLSRFINLDKGEYDLGVIAGEVEDSGDDKFFSGHAGLLLTGDAGATGANVTAGLGARLQYLDGEGDSGGGLALGGQVRVKLPQATRVRFNAYAYYGPDASIFGDFDSFLEFSGSVGYEILRDAEFYVGYRVIEVGLDEGPDVDVEDGIHVGIRLDF
ncbi:MAG: YfaZ family outer membrane protein [Panacagrimonas sp.]